MISTTGRPVARPLRSRWGKSPVSEPREPPGAPAIRKPRAGECWGNGRRRQVRRRALGGRHMFSHLLTPVADSLLLSFIVAALPVLAVLVLLGVMRRPAWQAALAGLAG